jgi:gas vesicle protein
MSDRDEFGAFLIGFVIGGLTGAVVSLLLAPQSGEETRVYIKERAIELGNEATQTAQTVTKEVESRADVYRTKAEELAVKARASVDDLSKKGVTVFEEQKTKINEVVQSLNKPKDEAQAE